LTAETGGLTQRQRIEAAVYDARAQAADLLVDAELRVDPRTPPYPNDEHIDFLSFGLERLGCVDGLRILEVGSGSGELAVYLAHQGARVLGVDVSDANVRLARRRAEVNGVAGRTEFRAEPAEDIVEPEGSFDAIIGNQVLHHFDLKDALPKLCRLLRPGGRAIFCEPVLLLPEPLRRLRESRFGIRVLPRRVDTPTERSISLDDVSLVRRIFPENALYPFQLFTRLQNFLPLGARTLAALGRVDRFLLRRVAPVRWLCRFLVIEVARDAPVVPPAGWVLL
jgi:2-polyprenyl-3-methyl-5-hydroxy-6-metoxy-1,4-benzoquinol methylase